MKDLKRKQLEVQADLLSAITGIYCKPDAASVCAGWALYVTKIQGEIEAVQNSTEEELAIEEAQRLLVHNLKDKGKF